MKIEISKIVPQGGDREMWTCQNPMGMTYALRDFIDKVFHVNGRRWVVQGAQQDHSGSHVPCTGQVRLLVKPIED